MENSDINIPYETYQRLIDHLSIHAETDAWAKQLLMELQQLKDNSINHSQFMIWLSDLYTQN